MRPYGLPPIYLDKVNRALCTAHVCSDTFGTLIDRGHPHKPLQQDLLFMLCCSVSLSLYIPLPADTPKYKKKRNSERQTEK